MSDMMTFPDTWEDFEKSYGFTDNEEVYTNGARLIPSFRVKQWLDHLPSVQPRKGKWIEPDAEAPFLFGGHSYFPPLQCSVCGRSALNEPWYFCPNCGADMREGDSDD